MPQGDEDKVFVALQDAGVGAPIAQAPGDELPAAAPPADLTAKETKYQLLVRLVEEALEVKDNVRVNEIKEWLENNHAADYELLKASWNPYLSAAVADDTNRIYRVAGTYAYALHPVAPADEAKRLESAEPATEQGEADKPSYTKREALLYPAIADWLVGRGYPAEDTSAAKKGGTWGNPDVSGIRIIESYFGARQLELVTVEAKLSQQNWKQYIFEAISHKRFAHRSYFAFGFGTDEPNVEALPNLKDLRSYAEKYRVGILVVFVPAQEFLRITSRNGELAPLPSDVRVEEVWPAVHERVDEEELVKYLYGALGLRDDRALHLFGNSPK